MALENEVFLAQVLFTARHPMLPENNTFVIRGIASRVSVGGRSCNELYNLPQVHIRLCLS